jgi:hypothetical protein
VAVEGVAALRVASGGPPALMLGFARLPEHRIAQAVRLLAEAITMTRPGGPPHIPPPGLTRWLGVLDGWHLSG